MHVPDSASAAIAPSELLRDPKRQAALMRGFFRI